MSDAPPPAAAPSEAPQGEAPSKNALKKAQKEKEKVTISRALERLNLQLTLLLGREESRSKGPRTRRTHKEGGC